jgi:serine/threonine-protein kinase
VPKILDFGVSKTLGPNASDRTQTGNGAVLGCPEFMSPEQARGAESVDARTDVWSIGVVLYHALTGTAPFKAKNYNAMMVAILTRAHRPLLEVAPSVDPDLAALVECCLIKDRATRIQTAREVADRLSAIARRLAKAAGVSMAPRRRATDRLPGPNKSPSGTLPFNRDEMKALSRLRPRSGVIGITSAVVGIGIGALLALWYAGSFEPASSALPPMAPGAASPTPAPAAETRAPSAQAARVPDDEPSLAVAVARGLGLGKSRRHP